MSTTHDLDALLAEAAGEAPTVKLFGETWTLPVDVDAETMLRVQRIQTRVLLAKRAGVEIREEDVVDDAITLDQLVETMAGAENFAAWRAKTDDQGRKLLGYKALQVVAGKLFAIHSGMAQETQGKGRKRGQAKQTPKPTGTGQ